MHGNENMSRKLIFLTNHQAKLFQMNNIASFLESFDYPTPKLVIWFMSCSGGSSTINSGMLSSFKALRPSDPGFEQKWKELLKIQADNSPDPGYCQDVLPIAPFDTDEDLFKAEWKMECFMRDVLVPLAAETNALIVGSAFQDASLMMMFARVAKSLGSKYGGMGASPWTMLGFAGAPKLLKSLGDPKSTACEWFKLSKRVSYVSELRFAHPLSIHSAEGSRLSHTCFERKFGLPVVLTKWHGSGRIARRR